MSSKTNLPLKSAKKILTCISSDKKFNTFGSIYYNNLPALKWHHVISGMFGIHCSCGETYTMLCFNPIEQVNSIFKIAGLKKKFQKWNFAKKDYLD